MMLECSALIQAVAVLHIAADGSYICKKPVIALHSVDSWS